MDKESQRNNLNSNSNVRERSKGGDELLLSADPIRQTTTSEFVLQWGNRKRLRCMKVQVKDHSSIPIQKTTVRVDRRAVRTDKDYSNLPNNNTHNNNHHSNGYPNLRQRSASPQQQPQRILRGRSGSVEISVFGLLAPPCLPRNFLCGEGNLAG